MTLCYVNSLEDRRVEGGEEARVSFQELKESTQEIGQ